MPTDRTPAPRWFTPAAIAALLWNLLGCAAYLADAMASPEGIAKLSAAEQALRATRPAWSVAGTAVAVWFGALGSLGLILRKGWANPLLLLSLVGVAVQDAWMFGMSGAGAELGTTVVALQGVVLVVAIALVLLGRRAAARGWLG